jgi:NADH:ubiquinone reductase (H+-translocating)
MLDMMRKDNIKKKVVIIGGGFAGIQLARKIDKKIFDVLLIDKHNHHMFQPLFYQVATSQIEPSTISFPLRNIFKSKKDIQIRMARFQGIDREKKQVITHIGNFDYDYLVLAHGCKTNFFGNTEIEQNALTLKTTYDAIKIRNHMIRAFEKAVIAPEDKKDRYFNLIIVGAGATGVELAGAFAEIKAKVLPKDYPDVDFSNYNILLVEGSKNTLNNMSDTARKASMKYLKEMGVNVMTEVFVNKYDGHTAILSNGQEVKTSSVIWAAGVTANRTEGLPDGSKGPGNRICVDRQNKVLGCDNIFAIGDIALMQTPKYPKGHPQVANVAINQGKLLAKNLKSIEKGKVVTDFEYSDLGSMATIGNYKAVVDLPFFHFKGYFAWFVWMFLHLMLILSVRNKLMIFINWAWNFITRDSSLRLILTQDKDDMAM